jgi:hypothetical protein
MNAYILHHASLLLFLITIALFCMWGIVYLYRRAIVVWLCRLAMARNLHGNANKILYEARMQGFINFTEEARLRQEFGLPLTGILPQDPPLADAYQYFMGLLRFFFPSKKGK